MISMWKTNTVADVSLQKHSTKNNLIIYHLRINSRATDAALAWPCQPVTNIGKSTQQRMLVNSGMFACRPGKGYNPN